MESNITPAHWSTARYNKVGSFLHFHEMVFSKMMTKQEKDLPPPQPITKVTVMSPDVKLLLRVANTMKHECLAASNSSWCFQNLSLKVNAWGATIPFSTYKFFILVFELCPPPLLCFSMLAWRLWGQKYIKSSHCFMRDKSEIPNNMQKLLQAPCCFCLQYIHCCLGNKVTHKQMVHSKEDDKHTRQKSGHLNLSIHLVFTDAELKQVLSSHN